MTEVRFRGEQKGFNQAGGGVTVVTTGGGGEGGEKKEEGFGFIGGGSMKDWLIIMVVVVVGLMFLTHATGVPGQKGPGGGFAAFAATGNLIGTLLQWATFLLANPGIILFAVMCRSKTFRKYFPLGLIHEDLGITGFCKRFENLGEYSLWALIKDPNRAIKLQAMAAEIAENKAELVDKVLKDSVLSKDKNAKLFLSAVDNVGTLTPDMAKATTISEWHAALKDALDTKGVITNEGMKQQLTKLSTYLDTDAGKALMKNTKMINAVTSIRVLRSTKQLTNGFATMEATVGRAADMKIDTADKMLAFFAQNPFNLQGVHTAMNVPQLEGEALDDRFKRVINVATQDTSPKLMVKAQLRNAFKGLNNPTAVDAMAEAIGSLTKEQLSRGENVIHDLLETSAIQSNPVLKEAMGNLVNEMANRKSAAGAAAREGLSKLGKNVEKEMADATENLLKEKI